MRIFRKGALAILEHEGQWYQSKQLWNDLIRQPNLYQRLKAQLSLWQSIDFPDLTDIDAPIGEQEVWASGVTYLRSKAARMEESKDAGGGDFYDRVYDADRPELFFKSPYYKVVAPGGTVNIRRDSDWNVPEPELTLLISQAGTIEGYTCGNDMSSRSIEGENPLYLTQAKVYDGSAAIGPGILVQEEALDRNTEIQLTIIRGGDIVFQESIKVAQIKRSFQELVDYLYLASSFKNGCFLMTGTGIIPPDEFTLLEHDEVQISIDGIGTLINYVGLR
ncbi:MAG: fumarylacetoacetate hydrolase family protein [Saprospiraceae bacterium]|nr:fumarylacetoacetate hydrolase family protein [Saprospiraceae bacterium]